MSEIVQFFNEKKFIGLPLVFRTPETGWGGGVAGGLTFRLPKEPKDGRRSQVQLSFAYTAGIHFRYAPEADELYVLGTLAAVASLIIPFLMVTALFCTAE